MRRLFWNGTFLHATHEAYLKCLDLERDDLRRIVSAADTKGQWRNRVCQSIGGIATESQIQELLGSGAVRDRHARSKSPDGPEAIEVMQICIAVFKDSKQCYDGTGFCASTWHFCTQHEALSILCLSASYRLQLPASKEKGKVEESADRPSNGSFGSLKLYAAAVDTDLRSQIRF